MGRTAANWVRTLSFPHRLSPKKEDDNLGQPPSYTEIFPDADGEKAIMSSIVMCIHHKEGCVWRDELRKLKGHLNACKHDATPCENLCGARIPRLMMDEHMRFTCARRRANCSHCGQQFTGRTLEEHSGSCGQEPVYCDNKCGEKVARALLNQHRSVECSKRLTACQHCSKDFVADTLPVHISKCGKAPVSCPHKCDVSLTRDTLDDHLVQCPNVTIPCTFREAGCRFKGRKQLLDQHMTSSSQQHLQLLCTLVSRQQLQIASLRSALSRSAANTSGTLLWKIGDFAARMTESRAKDSVELVSTAFYTAQCGYKLQASLFLNGNGAGEGSHLSVYIKILPGEYDALLRWPFAYTVSFTMYDQAPTPETACNIVESFIPDPTWQNFQRPSKAPDALGFGFPRFISHEMLKRRFFIRDDVLFIRVKVEPGRVAAV